MKNIGLTVLFFLMALTWSQSLPQFGVAVQAAPDLPTFVYLVEGAATYTNDSGWNFIVKRDSPNDFVWVQGPTYTADATERVWRSQRTGGAPPFAYHEDTVFGEVTAGCLIRYVAIDDDVDGRINSFFLNGTLIHAMMEGMVAEGEFIIPFDGELLYNAKDSIGMYLDVCSVTAPPAPPPSETSTPTTLTPAQTPSPTRIPPREKACLRINFEVGGDEARNGRFQVIEVSGRVLYTWDAQDGWEDSGWARDIEITYRSVHVQVFYWANSSDPPITMRIINPAPGTEYGWVSESICHALEVAWP